MLYQVYALLLWTLNVQHIQRLDSGVQLNSSQLTCCISKCFFGSCLRSCLGRQTNIDFAVEVTLLRECYVKAKRVGEASK